MNLHLALRKSNHRMIIAFLKQVFIVFLCLFVVPHVVAADNITTSTVENNTGITGVSFQQYIIDLDMSYTGETLVQETWTLSDEGGTSTIGLSVPQDAIVMSLKNQDMSNTTSIVDLEYNRTSDILYFSDNITSISPASPQLYSLVYLLPNESDRQFTKQFLVTGYQPSSIHSLVLNVKTKQDIEPMLFDENGLSLSSNSQKNGNITTFFFSHPSFNEVTVSTTEEKASNNFMYLSALFFIAGLFTLGGAIYLNRKNKGTHKDTDIQELEYRYTAIQKVLSTVDSDLKKKSIDEDIHSSMSAKYRKEASAIKKELDKKLENKQKS
ncbi:hypothetical protein [uncultured Methanomethylovorans sp.]|uniref:hypothetical protein n=1 Tax=uncultured Methanomethylovorans sp. TaxID=183759 RepID=UPI002AA7F6ED|nr:hypothetical protein [uncultured Methanomethylovorans sp.]